MNRMTRVTCVDVDTGESETIEIRPDQYIVICGADDFERIGRTGKENNE